MLFNEVIKAIHSHLMNDADVPTYMRNLIQMLCDIPENEWYSKRDPSSKESYQDSSLRKFYTNGISKKLAKKMLSRLTRDNFIESINHPHRSDVVLEGLAEDIRPFVLKKVSKDNVAEELFSLLKKSLEYVVDPSLENDRIIKEAQMLSEKLKGQFGSGLLEDCDHYCSMPSCKKHLQTFVPNGISAPNYEIIKIDNKKNANYSNIIAVCHDCFQNYILNPSAANKKGLKRQKTLQVNGRNAKQILDESEIDRSISIIVEALANLKGQESQDLNYDPVPINNKISPKSEFNLFNMVKSNVSVYYGFIEKTMKQLARQNIYNDELIRVEIKTMYKRLAQKTDNKLDIFEDLAKQINKISNQNMLSCYIVVSYFIQSCEVFDVIAE